MEIWKPINGYNGMYEISNLGRARSLDREVVYKNGIKCKYKGRILEAKQDSQEYNMVILSKNGKIRAFKKSRLVAIHFLENKNNYKVVNHINGNKKDDRVENLEWCTYSYNNIHAFNTGLNKKKCKYTGVSFHRNKYEAFIYRNNKNIYLGRFDTEEEANEIIINNKKNYDF